MSAFLTKLGLGSAQFGLDSQAPVRGRPPAEEVRDILSIAARSGVRWLDAGAAAPHTETRLAAVLPQPAPFQLMVRAARCDRARTTLQPCSLQTCRRRMQGRRLHQSRRNRPSRRSCGPACFRRRRRGDATGRQRPRTDLGIAQPRLTATPAALQKPPAPNPPRAAHLSHSAPRNSSHSPSQLSILENNSCVQVRLNLYVRT